MANVLVEESCLSGIASAIRTQNGLNTLYKPSEMMSGINDLRANIAWSGFLYNVSINSTNLNSTEFYYSNSKLTSLRPGAFANVLFETVTTINLPTVKRLMSTTQLAFNTDMRSHIGFQFADLSVTTIYLSAFDTNYIPAMAFANCKKLSNLVIGSTVLSMKEIGAGAFYKCSALSEIPSNLVNVTSYIWSNAFRDCTSLQYVSLPLLSCIEPYAFRDCTNISYIDLPSVKILFPDVFSGCKNLQSISIPKAYTIGNYAFANVNLSGDIIIPEFTATFGSYIMYNHSSATNTYTLSLPKAFNVQISDKHCKKLWASSATAIYINYSSCGISEVYGDSVQTFSASNNSNLIKVSLPVITTLTANAFNNCQNLSDLYVPSILTVAMSAFKSCYNLSKLSLPAASVISSYAFSYCSKLISLYLMGSSVCKLSAVASYVFTGCPIYDSTVNNNVYGSIYVPSSLYATYKASTNWVAISSRFVSM